ncbi:MAG: hypothetical protein AB1728_06850 [Bacteroidota bacterium]
MNQFDAAIAFLLPIVVTLTVKTISYIIVFKIRDHTVALMTCVTLGGALIVPVGIVGLPPLLGFAAGIGIAIYILTQYTDVPLLLEGLIVIFGIEIGYAFLERLLIAPLLY